VRLVDERRERGLGSLDPLARVTQAARVLRDRDDLQVLALQLLVECLPDRQVEAAPSPGGPGDEEDLLATVVGQPVHAPGGIR
jgi:hypothetical protein